MSYKYYGTSGLIELPGETQRVIDGNAIVIEKDYAIRKDRLAFALQSMAPGSKMPGTNYIIDTQPQFQIGADGFARVRLSGLNLNFIQNDSQSSSIRQDNIQQQRVDINEFVVNQTINITASFSYASATIKYIRSVFAESQDPDYPNIIQPVLFSADIKENLPWRSYQIETTFGPSKWIGYNVSKNSLYENRATEYIVDAICAPSFIRMSATDVTVEYTLFPARSLSITSGSSIYTTVYPVIGNMCYQISQLYSTAQGKIFERERLLDQLRAAEQEFELIWRSQITSANAKALGDIWRGRISEIEKQLAAL